MEAGSFTNFSATSFGPPSKIVFVPLPNIFFVGFSLFVDTLFIDSNPANVHQLVYTPPHYLRVWHIPKYRSNLSPSFMVAGPPATILRYYPCDAFALGTGQ